MIMDFLPESVKHILDLLAGVAAFLGVFLATTLPILAATASLIWYGIRIYEWYKAKQNGNVKLD
jgi:nitrogen fixation protein FixH